jgi:geranylgeranyl pyrophosphate synthase
MAQEKPAHVTNIPAPIEEAVEGPHPSVEDASQSPNNEVHLNDSALMGPVHYIQSLPSKNVRSKLIDAFNIWLQIPDSQLDVIKDAVSDLHNASLILDDIQDESGLRRGSAATHRIFGEAQSINSATYMILHAALRLYNEDVKTDRPLFRTFLTGLVHLTQGQSWDLQWKFNSHCPSAAEYMAMVDGKTGAMFDMLVGTMHALTTQPWELSIFSRLTQLLGRWFQIRDDYQNLQDPRYAEQKGFAEDLDEGKLSYPVIVCCNADATARAIILGILRAKQRDGKPLDHSVKLQLLGLIRSTEALSQTWTVVQQLQKEIEECLSNVERVTGIVNPQLHLVVKMLSDVAPP